MPWLQVVGFLLAGAAVWIVFREREQLGAAWASARSAPLWQLALIALLPAVSWAVISVLFWAITSQYTRVRVAEMFGLLGSAWLLNVVPMRPGLMGRVAYHKFVNGMPVRDSVKVGVYSVVTQAAALAWVAGAAGLAALANNLVATKDVAERSVAVLGAMVFGAIAGLLTLAWVSRRDDQRWRFTPARLPMAQWRLALGTAMRLVDVSVWVARYYLLFGVLGKPITWPEAAGVTIVSQVFGLLPTQLGMREWSVGLVTSMLPSMHGENLSPGHSRTATGLTVDLFNRVSELVFALPVGLVCTVWMYRRLAKAAGGSVGRAMSRVRDEPASE